MPNQPEPDLDLVVLGGGVVGSHACHIALGMGADGGRLQICLLHPIRPATREDIGRAGIESRVVIEGSPDHRGICADRDGGAEEVVDVRSASVIGSPVGGVRSASDIRAMTAPQKNHTGWSHQ